MQTTLNTELKGDTLNKRADIQREINSSTYSSKERSFEMYKQTTHEKKEVKLLKREYKKFKGTAAHTQKRDELANQIMKTSPKFNVTLNLAN